MKTSKYIQLEQELSCYKKLMGEAADQILDPEVSSYPIFVVNQQEVAVGIPLTEKEQIGNWTIHASSLEEFVSKQLIEENLIDFR